MTGKTVVEQSQPQDVNYYTQQIENSRSLIELHHQNIKSYESRLYDLLLQKRDTIKKQQEELRKELEKVESQLLVWDFEKEF